MHAGAPRLERHQRLPLRGDAVQSDDAEPLQLVLREIDAAERVVLGHVAHDVDQLERDPERACPLAVARAVHRDAGDADRARDLLAVAAQLVEGRIPRLLEILQAAVDERSQRLARNPEALARVGERDERRVLRRRVELRAQRLEPPALLRERQPAVGDVVDLARERVDRRDRPPLLARQHHDPVREVLRPRPRDALYVAVCLVYSRHRTNTSAASRASRARDGFGRCVKTSQLAASSASSAARPPRAKRPTARPSRPPIRARSTSPARSSVTARSASKRSSARSSSLGRSSPGPPKRRRSSAGRYTRPSSRSLGTSWRKFTSWSPVHTESLAATSSASSSRRRTPRTSRPQGSAE